MKKRAIVLLLVCFASMSLVAEKRPTSTSRGRHPARDLLSTDRRFLPVDAVIEDLVSKGTIPGAVLLVGQKGKVIYRKAYGHRAIVPAQEPMTVDTIFDIASLTKCVATATSITRMLELGQLRLNDTIGKFIPEFAINGKEEITIRELMTHYSGLRPDLDLRDHAG